MLPIEEPRETLCEGTKPIKTRTCCKLRIVLGLVVLLVVLVFLFFALQPTYTATAYLQIMSSKPYFVFEEKPRNDYDDLVNTYFALIKSPIILEKVLEDPSVAQLPIIKTQKDKTGWLARKLKLQRKNNSEIITVSITLPVPEDAEKIVNSVIIAFFDYYSSQSQDWNLKLLTQLNLELNRQKTMARMLQAEIQSKIEKKAKQNEKSGVSNFTRSESLLQELYLNESKLETLRSELKTLLEVVDNPSELEIPEMVIRKAVENDPMMIMLQQKIIDLQNQIETLKKMLQNDDSKILALQEQIKEVEEKIEEEKQKTEEIKKQLQAEYVRNLGTKLIETQIAVRSQTLLVDHLRQKDQEQQEQLAIIGDQTAKAVDTQFQQDQLRRVNTVLAQLESRVIAIETERYAPPQIELKRKAVIPTQPNRWCCWW
ncbi:MAG: hypothetical protein LBC20_08605 [Planctomycetaceae bacterium]|jgi:capsular polysaccharide biosynthesis protein|nr:hypothetical protein [Planctomycetaceae bacterium]